MFELIHRAARLCCECFEPNPHQKRTTDMIALDTCLATLAAFQPGHLFAFPTHLLNFPAEATRLLCGRSGLLSQVVGHDVVRAVGRHHNPEQLHFVLLGKPLILIRLPCASSAAVQDNASTRWYGCW